MFGYIVRGISPIWSKQMAKSLGFMMRGGLLAQEHSMSAMHDLMNASDRAAAIVGGSFIEMILTDTLKLFMHKSEKITNELFRPSGALGAFATKIHLGYLIGLYGAEAHKDFLTVKDIRNLFAHSLENNSFKSQKISHLCSKLKLCERYTIDQSELGKNKPRKAKPNADTPLKDWDFWVILKNRDETLKDPRERYIATFQVLTYPLVVPDRTAMPKPLF